MELKREGLGLGWQTPLPPQQPSLPTSPRELSSSHCESQVSLPQPPLQRGQGPGAQFGPMELMGRLPGNFQARFFSLMRKEALEDAPFLLPLDADTM